ncbi:MAG: hypothetical protein ACP5MD_00290 [Verrucomicrobiia bacterium]
MAQSMIDFLAADGFDEDAPQAPDQIHVEKHQRELATETHF